MQMLIKMFVASVCLGVSLQTSWHWLAGVSLFLVCDFIYEIALKEQFRK